MDSVVKNMDNQLKKVYIKENDFWGLPQTFKSIKFYPLKLKDVEAINLFYKIFQYPKNYIADKKILKLSYLKYLTYVVQYSVNSGGKEISNGLLKYLKMCTKQENVEYIYDTSNFDGENLDGLIMRIKIGEQEFNETDFDIIRGIILEQNGLSIDYVESFNPELEEFLAYTGGELKDTDFEDQVFTFASLMNKTVNEVGEYTLYQFKKHFSRLVHILDYQLYSPLEISGQIKSKSGGKIVKHYMIHLPEQKRYDSVLISQDVFLTENPDFPDEHGNIISKNKKQI